MVLTEWHNLDASDAAVGESLSSLGTERKRKQNQSGEVLLCLASASLDSGQTIDKYLFSYHIIC